MRPVRAANQLTGVWRTICSAGGAYPVDCRLLAAALNVKVYGEPIDDKFEAMLRIRGKTRAIIYNENIREEGRKNFCISHELGHHSCHSDKREYFCSADDLADVAPHPQNIEQEANQFAANLLMPVDDFREQTRGRPATLATLSELAENRYGTTLTAACTRLIELSPKAMLGMAIVRNGSVVRWMKTEEMRWTGFGFRRGHKLPSGVVRHNLEGEQVESDVWLNDKNAPRWNLRQSAAYMPYYCQALVLIEAERAVDLENLDEPDPTPPSLPPFR